MVIAHRNSRGSQLFLFPLMNHVMLVVKCEDGFATLKKVSFNV